MSSSKYDICVVGGGGHVGLPLSLLFANTGSKVCIYDINKEVLEKIDQGEMPFCEEGAGELLKNNIGKNIFTSNNPEAVSESKVVIIIIGTPVDEHLNPQFNAIKKLLDSLKPYFREGQLLVLRSTIFPGSTQKVNEYLIKNNINVKVAFCPERIAQGKSISEMQSLPQIISAFDEQAIAEVSELFKKISPEIIILEPLEAELAKLFTNSWRYIEFAAANQFYSIASKFGVDFSRLYEAITHNYPRAQHFPSAGFAAGPCLFKDTMQIAAFNNNDFPLGISAMLVNEGMPNVIVQNLKRDHKLSTKKVGVLGMAFKGNSDDKRESLAYKLKKMLEMEADQVLCTDVYIKDKNFVSVEDLINQSDIIVLGCPHKEYKTLSLPTDKVLIDVWNFITK